jgi:hypothetical protein
MKIVRTLMLGALTLAGLALPAARAGAQVRLHAATDLQILQNDELPTGGTTVADPRRMRTLYYWKNEVQAPLEAAVAGRKGISGLYRSENGGKTWERLTSKFQFRTLFIHPGSGELFAITRENNDKFREVRVNSAIRFSRSTQLLRSLDGRSWRNIPIDSRFVSNAAGIQVDPDHPQRIRLIGYSRGKFYVVAGSDEYSGWTYVDPSYGPEF